MVYASDSSESEGNSAVTFLVPRLPSHATLSWQRPPLGDFVSPTPPWYILVVMRCLLPILRSYLLLSMHHSYYHSNFATDRILRLLTASYMLLSVLLVHVQLSGRHRTSDLTVRRCRRHGCAADTPQGRRPRGCLRMSSRDKNVLRTSFRRTYTGCTTRSVICPPFQWQTQTF